MRRSKFSEFQIVKAIKEHEGGRKVDDICRELSVSKNTFYKWESRYGGMEASDVKRIKELEEENARLKKMYAEMAMDNHILKDLFTKKGWALPPKNN